MATNQMWRLARHPPGPLPEAEDFAWTENDVPAPAAGQMLTATIYLSLDPYQWGRRRNGTEPIGTVCHGRTVSQVIESRMVDYSPGDFVFNTNGWQRFGLTGAGIDNFGYMHPRRLDPAAGPISLAVGVLGMLGLTAWSGLMVQAKPKAGETVVVSAAAGGVGQIVGQIAKLLDCRVVGVAGTPEKCTYVVDELGFDECVSHRSKGFESDLARACPDGINVYFENVGGRTYSAVLPLLNNNSRITLCGLVSQYGSTNLAGIFEHWYAEGSPIFARRNTAVHKLFVGDFVDHEQDRFLGQMTEWVRDGSIKYREDIWEGLERAPEAFRAMLEGRNFGKTLALVQPDPTATP